MSVFREIFRLIGQALNWWVVVVPWEQVLRVRLGKHEKLLEAGVHLKIPGIDRVYRQSTRTRWTELKEQTLTTSDGKTIDLQGMLGYCIVDLHLLYNTLHHAETTVQGDAMSLLARYVHGHTLAECRPADLEDFLNKTLDLGQYGLGGVRLSLTDFVIVPRTYRFLTTPNERYFSGDRLNTQVEEAVKDKNY